MMSTSAGSTPGPPPGSTPLPPYTLSRDLPPSSTRVPSPHERPRPCRPHPPPVLALLDLPRHPHNHASHPTGTGRSAGPEPHRRLALGREELRGDARYLLRRQRFDGGEHLVETRVGLAVDWKTRQTIHPGGGTLQRQHQLALSLLLRLGEGRAVESPARQLRVLLGHRPSA